MAQKGYIKNSLTKDLGAPEMANMFQGILGASGIMSLYENLACVKVDNNTVRMSSGAYNLSGHLLGIAKGTTEDLTIDSGTSGQNRNDLIVAEFVRNGGGLGVDTLHFTVVKGTSTSGTAADPALTQQDINAAGVTRQEALYRVKVVGSEITAVEKVAGSVSNLNLVDTTVASHLAENATKDKLGHVYGFRGARVVLSSNQSITSGTLISWDATTFDNFNFWNANTPTRFTIPEGVNLIRLHVNLFLPGPGVITNLLLRQYKNGGASSGLANYRGDFAKSNSGNIHLSSSFIEVEQGDYFEISTSGDVSFDISSLHDYTNFSIEVIE